MQLRLNNSEKFTITKIIKQTSRQTLHLPVTMSKKIQ